MDTAPGPMPPELEAGEASAEAGVVMLDGPDGVAVAMSPDAAEETGRRLIAAAQEARRQTVTTDALARQPDRRVEAAARPVDEA